MITGQPLLTQPSHGTGASRSQVTNLSPGDQPSGFYRDLMADLLRVTQCFFAMGHT